MQKSFRLFALVAALTLTVAPVHAEQMGTNPHPQIAAPLTTMQLISYTVLSYFGF